MNILDRLLLFIFSVIVAISSFVFVFLPLPFLPTQYREALHRFIFESNGIALISIILLMLSLRFIFKTTATGINAYNYISKETDMGEIRISFNTIKALSLSSIRNIDGIKDAKAQVDNTEGELSILITVGFIGGTKIPEVSKEIQRNVKELIEGTTEIRVKEVVVFVDETNNSNKRRVD
ncbi:MAG: alkaline shock response membrane anchor protein AmaP [Lutispora sp.]|nr:alkaline shock response membrane anchor protein AmaP [Lutispora sp.]